MKIKSVYVASASALLLSMSACAQWPWQESNTSSSPANTAHPQSKEEGNMSQKNTSSKSKDGRTVQALDQQGVHVVANPASTLVLVNKHFKLPDNYTPSNLVYPDVPFITSGRLEKTMMKKIAADALEKMFAAAKKGGIGLAGVSAYRSHAAQVSLFNSYVQRDGEERALNYSARPGTSEHETGLAIDVSGISGRYAATQAFANTTEAKWLAKHAQDYGFIVRYPKGKESVTGYEYEAWHLRYVGVAPAQKMYRSGWALEEYLGDVPVNN